MDKRIKFKHIGIVGITTVGAGIGCTELPEVYNQENLGISVVDTIRLLAQKAFEFSI